MMLFWNTLLFAFWNTFNIKYLPRIKSISRIFKEDSSLFSNRFYQINRMNCNFCQSLVQSYRHFARYSVISRWCFLIQPITIITNVLLTIQFAFFSTVSVLIEKVFSSLLFFFFISFSISHLIMYLFLFANMLDGTFAA